MIFVQVTFVTGTNKTLLIFANIAVWNHRQNLDLNSALPKWFKTAQVNHTRGGWQNIAPCRDLRSSSQNHMESRPVYPTLDEGDIGVYPIPQYRKKNLQIPKYRVENRRNTDTAFMISHAYLMLYPSRALFISSMYTPENNRSLR